MKVFLQPPQPSRGLQRIADALYNNAPEWVTPVDHEDESDLVVIYAIGRHDAIERQCREILKQGKQYAVIQVCLKSTMAPNACYWQWIWSNATVVWSYYDLLRALYIDGEGLDFSLCMNFYHAPLGADADVFYPRQVEKNAIIATSGSNRLQESIRECALAAMAVSKDVFHVGGHHKWYSNMSYSDGADDDQLAMLYSACHFVSGLRRTEGFELPAVEGLLCGARPILFNSSDYRRWYEPWGEFIEETDRQGVVDQLVELFKKGARPVTATERAEAAMRFNWETIVRGFYERLGTDS